MAADRCAESRKTFSEYNKNQGRLLPALQTVDKVGAGNYPQHHFSINTG